jgi:hypothetical protein
MAKEEIKEVVVEKAEVAKKPEPKVVKPEVPAGAKVTTMDNGTVRIDY